MISANVVEELYGAGWIRDDVQVIFQLFQLRNIGEKNLTINPKHDNRLIVNVSFMLNFGLIEE